MTDENNQQDDDVLIYEPDFSLKKKLVGTFSLEAILTPAVTEDAEKVIASMEPHIMEEISATLRLLEAETATCASGHPTGETLQQIGALAFAIKSRAGLCGYTLASSIARSLHLFCETLPPDKPFGAREREIISCLVLSLKTLFSQHIKGMGGDVGTAITAELQRLTARFS